MMKFAAIGLLVSVLGFVAIEHYKRGGFDPFYPTLDEKQAIEFKDGSNGG